MDDATQAADDVASDAFHVECDPEDCDLTTDDYRKFFEYGFAHRGPVVTVKEGDDWRPAVRAYQDSERYWGAVWFAEERGGYQLADWA